MSRRPSHSKSAPAPEPRPGDAARWYVYINTALEYVDITPQRYPEKPSVSFYATIPGFEGLSYASSEGDHFLTYVRTTLERWLVYRLANQLPLPRFPGLEPPTLEDLAEFNAVIAGQAFDQAILEDAALPLEQLLATQQQASGWVLADEHLLARDWLTPEEDKAWQDL